MPSRRADSCVSRYRRLANMPSADLVVTGIAIGHRKKLHGVTGLDQLVGRTGELDIAIVGVGADSYDPEFALLRRDGKGEQKDECEPHGLTA